MQGRLDYPRGLAVTGSIQAMLSVPEVNPRKILAEVRVEDDLGQEAVFPLAVEQMGYLLDGSALVPVGVADRRKGRVPGPLVRIQPGAWSSVLTRPVELQNLLRLLDKRRIVLWHRSRLLFFCFNYSDFGSSNTNPHRSRRSQNIGNSVSRRGISLSQK